MAKNNEPHVVQYESSKGDHQYARFWDTRAYEDRAERILLKSLLRQYPREASWLVDVGGSFGRLIDSYKRRFHKMAIIDYAANEFYIGKEAASAHKMDLTLVAGNAYHIPLTTESQQALISIRVMHHLEEPELFFAELHRVLSPGGVAIVEAANKNHFKRFLRSLVRFDFSEWRADWVDVGASGVQENETFSLIRNYSPSYLESLIEKSGLSVEKKKSISWMRRTPLTRLPNGVVDLVERIMQAGSGLTMMGPSNWYVLRKEGTPQPADGDLKDSLAEPKSKKPASSAQLKAATSTKNKAKFYDLRYPRPQ